MEREYYNNQGHPISNDLKKYAIIDRKTDEIVCVFEAPNRFGGAHMPSYRPEVFQKTGLDFELNYKYGSGKKIEDLEVFNKIKLDDKGHI